MEKIFSGKYEIQSEIARGGMGVIYKAVHTTLNRGVAIKILHPQYSGDPAFHKRFQREARAMARLDHENIIRVFDVSEDHGSHYIVMEFFDGKDLKHLILEKGRLAAHEALSIAYQMAGALSYAHSQGVIHRDVKPGNIMVDRNMKVKIADFGIAAATDEISVTATGQIIGTPEYMSPEQARGDQLDGRSDLYSLGVVIYEMLTGRTPYEGISRMAIVGKLVYDQEELSLSFPEDVPPAAQKLVQSLLRKQPENRIQSAQILITELEQLGIEFRGAGRTTSPMDKNLSPTVSVSEEEGPTVMLHETPAGITPPSRPPTTPVVPQRFTTPAPQPAPEAGPARRTRETPVSIQTPKPDSGKRNFLPLIAGGVGVILLAGGAVYYFTSARERPASIPEPVQRTETQKAPSPAETELREILRSIRDMQDQVSTARSDADAVDAQRLAQKAYQQANNDESVGSQALQEGSNLINLKQYEAAKGSLQEALTLLTQARGGFVQSREAATAKTAKEERIKKSRAEAERIKKIRDEAEKTAKAIIPDKPSSPPTPSGKKAVMQAPSAVRPDIQVIGEILAEFKRNYESRDLQTLKRTSDMSEGRARFLQQIFQDYSSISTTIADLSLTSESASAVLLITKLVDHDGNTVPPGEAWKKTKVIIKKQGNQWGKITW